MNTRNAPLSATLIALAVACAAATTTACHVLVSAAVAVPPMVQGDAQTLVGTPPQPPFDETPITPVETAGASRYDN